MGTSGIEQRNGTCYTEKECKQRNGIGVGGFFTILLIHSLTNYIFIQIKLKSEIRRRKILAQIDQLAKLLHTVAVDLNWRIHTVAVGFDWLFGSYLVNFGPFYLIFTNFGAFWLKLPFETSLCLVLLNL